MFSSLILIGATVAVVGLLGFAGNSYLTKNQTGNEDKRTLPEKKQKLIEMVEEDFVELKRDMLVEKLQKYDLDAGFLERLPKVHALFEEKDYRHPRAHTFYTTLLPRLLKVKEAKGELSEFAKDTVATDEMYASLNEWMDEIINNKIDGLENEAEVNAKVITLMTK